MKKLLLIPMLLISICAHAECTDEEVSKILEIRELQARKSAIDKYKIRVAAEEQRINAKISDLQVESVSK